MNSANIEAGISRKYHLLVVELDERRRRQWAAAESRHLGWGGISLVSRATGLTRPTIMVGLRELKLTKAERSKMGSRIRRSGGGRHRLTENDPGLLTALESLIEPLTRGDPESWLRWTCKSTSKLADELIKQNHPVTDRTVASLLKQSGYSLQANRKTREGASHPDRNAQFEYLNTCVTGFNKKGQPVISVDTKKKELIGNFKNAGSEWRPKGKPKEVLVHDFPDKTLGKAIPYGVYDMVNNQGWVSVGINHDTAQFAVNSIRCWWKQMGQQRFPNAKELLITADGGGSNGHRSRLWKVSLQELANDLDLKLIVCHFPPGTSKWNKIEHRLFSFITQNWRGKPLVSHNVIVNLIASTTTRTGLIVKAAIDTHHYETKIKVSNEELAHLRLTRHKFHGDWNYTICPCRR